MRETIRVTDKLHERRLMPRILKKFLELPKEIYGKITKNATGSNPFRIRTLPWYLLSNTPIFNMFFSMISSGNNFIHTKKSVKVPLTVYGTAHSRQPRLCCGKKSKLSREKNFLWVLLGKYLGKVLILNGFESVTFFVIFSYVSFGSSRNLFSVPGVYYFPCSLSVTLTKKNFFMCLTNAHD